MNIPARLADHLPNVTALDGAGVMELIRSEGGRATGARRVILDALTQAGGSVTAEQLSEQISADHPEIHQSTVYRTLDRFEALGIAHHTHLGHGPAQWHLASKQCSYLVCQCCGQVTEVDPSLFADLGTTILQQLGFQLDLQHFAITGTCQTCLQTAAGVQ